MQPRSSRKARFGFFVPFLFLIIVAGVFFNTSLFSFFSNLVVQVQTLFPSSVTSSRVEDLERELTRVRYQAVLYQLLAEERDALKHQLALTTDAVVATGVVVARPPKTHYDTLLVVLPAGHQVLPGDRALFEEVVLGVVDEVSARSARVTLFSSGGTTVDARVGTPQGIVVLSGVGGGAFVFDVTQTISVSPGDRVVSAEGSGRTLAIVARVVAKPDSTLTEVYARLPVAFADLSYVSFIRPIGDDL